MDVARLLVTTAYMAEVLSVYPCSMSDVSLIYGPPEDEITSAGTDDISNQTRQMQSYGCGKTLHHNSIHG